MAVTLSSDAIAELQKSVIRTHMKLEVIHEFFNADLRQAIDVSDDVNRWGTLDGDSTMVRKDWTVPNLTVIMNNTAGRFTDGYASSIWTDELSGVHWSECFIRWRYYLLMKDGTVSELLYTYVGKLIDVVHRFHGRDAIAELKSVMYQDIDLSHEVTKFDGDYLKVLYNNW